MRAAEVFEQTYKRVPQNTAFTPYRICPLGAHVDHQLGRITGFAIDKGVHIAYGPKENGVIELTSMQFPKRAQWHVEATPKHRETTGQITCVALPLHCTGATLCAGACVP